MKSKKQNTSIKIPYILLIPNELLISIASLCAESSIFILLRLRLVCKRFKEICDDNVVLQKASLEHLQFKAFRSNTKVILQTYRSLILARNPEAMYRVGHFLYFHWVNEVRGLKLLKEAAEANCRDAQYLCGTILICNGGEDKSKSFTFMKSFLMPTMSETLKELCKYSWRINQQLYPSTYIPRKQLLEKYVKGICGCNGQTKKYLSLNNNWLGFDSGNDMKTSEACLTCLWDYEVKHGCCGYYLM